MLGPVMNSGSTGNADTSPADDGMQPDWGLFSRNVHLRDRRTGLPDAGSYTVAGGVFGRGPRSAVSRTPVRYVHRRAGGRLADLHPACVRRLRLLPIRQAQRDSARGRFGPLRTDPFSP